MRIGIFDSGIGGLTVLKNLYKNYPLNEYIYLGDTINLPYGNKTREELNELASKDVEFLLDKKVDAIVIACGTVSSNCLDYLRDKYNVPIYDIISPTIKYLNESEYSNIGVIATNATINSGVFNNNVNKNIYEIRTPLFVNLIENNRDLELDRAISEYLSMYKDKIDLLVLGCTHYPLIREHLNKYFDNKVKLLDMSDLLLDKFNNGTNGKLEIYFSMLNDIIIENTKMILNIKDLQIMKKPQ